MTSDVINLPSTDIMELSFDWAHNYWSTSSSESGYVELSTDNITWTALWSRTGSAFDSDPTDMFPPAFAQESISLAAYAGQSIYLRIRGISDYGSDFLFDDICIYAAGTIMPGSISGIVLDDSGDPYCGLTATLMQTGETCVVDSVGYYSFSNVAPGNYEVSFSLYGYTIEEMDNVIVSTNNDTDAGAMITRGGILVGNIVNDLGEPVFCAVNLSGLLYQTYTDSIGNYSIVQIQEGYYDVRAFELLYCSEVFDSVFIAEDTITVVDFQMIRNCRIQINISTFDSNYDNMNIALTGAQDYSFPHHYPTILLRDMTPGTYDISVSRDGCATFTSTGIVIDPGTCDTIDVFLDELTGSTSNNTAVFKTEFNGAYPNPFNPETTLKYSISESGTVELLIYNIKGQKVSTLVNDEHEPGEYSVIWKGKNDYGKSVSTGVYFAVLKTDNKEILSKLMLLK